MAYEEILTVNSSIQSKRTTKAIANSSTETLKDGELLIVRDGNNPPNLRAGDGATQIKNLKDIVPGAASTSTAGLMSASDKTKLDGIATGANKTIVDSTLSSTSTNPVQNKVINTELGKKLPLSGGTMTGALTTKGIKLTSGTDYGATLPSNPVANQLFFQTAGSNFILDNVYPVGAVYISINSTSPQTLFGGTWEQIQGQFLLGASSSYPAGSTGGSKDAVVVAHSHNPANQSGYYGFITSASKAFTIGDMGSQSGSGRYYPYSTSSYDISRNTQTGSTGVSGTDKNMPPYLAVYMWYRTA